MNFLFISPHYPTTTSPLYCRRLMDLGVNVLGIGDAHANDLPAQLREGMRAYRHVPNMNDVGAVVAVARELRDRCGTIDRVDSNIEHWLTTEAAIRADQHVFGMQPEYLVHARSKIGMKDLFAEAGVPLMAGIHTHDKERVREFAMFHGFPVFLKPDTGVGSLGTFKVESIEELDARLPDLPDTYLCEPFIKGRIVTFDGLADRNSEVFYHTSHTYRAGVADMIKEAGDTHIYSFRELPRGLEELGRRAVKSFGVQERFFHIEFFETGPGEYLALEMNLRAPGSTLLHLMNYASDLDIFAAWARLVAKGDNKLAYERKYHAAHVGRRDALRYKHPHAEVLDRLGPALVHHARLPTEDHPGLGTEAYIIRHENFEELRRLIAYIEEKG